MVAVLPRRVALDLDGFLWPFYEKIALWHDAVYGTSLADSVHSGWPSVWLEKVWGGTGDEAEAKVAAFYDQLDFLRCPPIVDAVEMVHELVADHDDEVFVITANTHLRGGQIGAWLDRWFPLHIQGLIQTDLFPGGKLSKAEAMKRIGARVMGEDRVDSAAQVAAAGFPSVVVDLYQWSRAPDTELIRHVPRLADVPEAINRLLA